MTRGRSPATGALDRSRCRLWSTNVPEDRLRHAGANARGIDAGHGAGRRMAAAWPNDGLAPDTPGLPRGGGAAVKPRSAAIPLRKGKGWVAPGCATARATSGHERSDAGPVGRATDAAASFSRPAWANCRGE